MKDMNIFKINISIILLLLTIGFVSCTDQEVISEEIQIVLPIVENQQKALLDFFEESGNYINSPQSPFLLDVEDIKANMDKYLLIDMRYHEDYYKGHIDGAINVDRENIIAFLKTLNIYQYEKIILIDNTGQGSAYVASILRAIGYGNIFPMKYGMSVWNNEFAFNWTDKLADKYASFITVEDYPKNKKGDFPTINTAGKSLSEILEIRAQAEINFYFAVTIDSLYANKDDYYIINYWPKAKYDEAHMIGAHWYEPKKSLNPSQDLSTIPTNKKVIVYCISGQNSSAVAGYLRLLGYDAYSLRFGANSFMHKDAIANEWRGFVAKEKLHNYPMVLGEFPSKKKEAKANTIKNPDLNFKHRKVVQPDPSEVCD